MYISVCCTPGRIRRSPLPTLYVILNDAVSIIHLTKKKSKIILLVDFRSRWRRCFVWRCVVDDINRCTCRCVVHPVGSEDPPYRHFELLIALIKLQRIKVSSLQTESPIFLHVFNVIIRCDRFKTTEKFWPQQSGLMCNHLYTASVSQFYCSGFVVGEENRKRIEQTVAIACALKCYFFRCCVLRNYCISNKILSLLAKITVYCCI